MRPRGLLLLSSVALAVALFAAPANAQTSEKKHPRLVSAQAARCATCHSKLIEEKKVVHPATEDCTACHAVEIGEGGTRITLGDKEPALCVSCHSEREGLDALPTPHPAAVDGCTGCHDPHATDFPRLLRRRQAEVCADCHDLASLGSTHGNLVSAGTTCTSCHDPHGTKTRKLLAGSHLHPPFEDKTCDACHRENFGERIRLQARGQKLCLACHDDPAAVKDRKSVHGALKDDEKGRAACLSCHNPHLSAQPKMLVAGGPDLCAKCHPTIVAAARAKTGHPAAADDCTSCHLPHASGETKLLESPRRELCAECHDTADAELRKKHLEADLTKVDCLSCHSPHGAGQPKLLAANVHPPVLEGCDNCHEGSFDKVQEKGESPLCLNCHSEIGELAAKATVKHDAMEAGPCIACHNPHAAPSAKLVREAAEGCGSCHSDKIPGDGEVGHGVIDLLGCQACHEPHGGAKAKLLRAEGAELCLACHGEAAVKGAAGGALKAFGKVEIPAEKVGSIRYLSLSADGTKNHPLTEHRTLGQPTAEELKKAATSFTGELRCLTCHDPHKGRTAKLLQWSAISATEACQHCHQK